METKICSKCKEIKILAAYNRAGKHGLTSRCKMCLSEKLAEKSVSRFYPAIENIDAEVWKDVPNYENLYAVSSIGRVKSLNYNATKTEKLLAFRSDKEVIIYLSDHGGFCD